MPQRSTVDQADPRQLEIDAVRRSSAQLRAELHRELRDGLPELAAPLRKLLARLEGAPLPCVGVVHLECPRCERREQLAFRCGAQCPLCGGRGAPKRLEHLIPEAPVRHWAISLPASLRGRLLVDHTLARKVGRAFIRAIFAHQRRAARREHGLSASSCGAINVTQRFGSGLQANLHFHALVLEGVYVRDAAGGDASPRFVELSPPTQAQRIWVLERAHERIAALLRTHPPPSDLEDELAALHARAEVTGKPIRGPRPASGADSRVPGPSWAASDPSAVTLKQGFSLEANERVEAQDRGGLRRLCRYVTRAPLGAGKLRPVPGPAQGDEAARRGRHPAGPDALAHSADSELAFGRPWADGTRGVRFEGGALARRLLSLLPRDQPSHAVAYHGVLAPNAALRWAIRPGQAQLPLALPPLAPGRPAPEPEPFAAGPPRPVPAPASRPAPAPVPVPVPASRPEPATPASPPARASAGLRCEVCEGQLLIVAVEDATDVPALVA